MKTTWAKRCEQLYLDVLRDPLIDNTVKVRMVQYKDGLWETPKTYKDGIAWNDGTWMVYNTCRMNRGVLKTVVYCRTREDLVMKMYDYLCFLKAIGIDEFNEMCFYAMKHIIHRLKFPKGVFDMTPENTRKLAAMVKSVKNNTCVQCERKDTRKYAFDPRMKNKKSVQRKTEGKITSERIKEFYDPSKTDLQNLTEFRKQGFVISQATLTRWKKNNSH